MKSSGSELGRRRPNVINIKGRQAAFNDCCCETFWNLYLHIYILINTVVIISLKGLEDEKYLAYCAFCGLANSSFNLSQSGSKLITMD